MFTSFLLKSSITLTLTMHTIQLKTNFAKCKHFSLPKTMKTFTEQIYDIVRKIPKGKYMTYKEITAKIGRPNASRAIGTALSKNYFPNVPYHHIIRTNGKINKYNQKKIKTKLEILKKKNTIL